MAKGDESVQISTGNPFGVLAKKKFKGDPNKFTSSDSKATKTQDAAPKQVVDKGPSKESRQIRLTESEKPAPTKEVAQDPPAESKKEREAKDKHVDRSGKRDQTRKSGQGKGGWDDHTTTDVEKAATTGDEKEEKEGEATTDENAPAKKEEKPEEEEAPTTTYEDYLKAQAEKKLNLAEFKIRQVDETQFKQMTVREGKPDSAFMSVKIEKPAPKAAPAPAAKGAKPNAKAAPAKPAPKVEAPKKKEVKETKMDLSDLGFRMAAPANTGRGGGRGGRGGGRGRGRGDGEGAPAGGERPAGRGRGGYQGGRGRGGDRPAGGNFQMNENDFPVLGKKDEAAPAAAE